MSRYVACLTVLFFAPPARSAVGDLPLPDVLLYGTVHVRGEQIVAMDPDQNGIFDAKVIVIARVNVDGTEREVGRYRFGDQQSDHTKYALRVRTESLAHGLARTGNAAIVGDTIRIYVRDERDLSPEHHTEEHVADFPQLGGLPVAGIIEELNLPAADAVCVYGDFDSDEDIDLGDFKAFRKCLGEPVPRLGCPTNLWMCTDVDRNGTIDMKDYGIFTTLFGRPPIACACGDFDSDAKIDLKDYDAFAACLGNSAPTETCPSHIWTCTDVNQDRRIDLRDFATFTRLFGTTPGSLVPPNCPN